MVNIGFGGKGRPHVPYATALDIFIILCFIAVFAALVEFACTNFLDNFVKRKLNTDQEEAEETEEKEEDQKNINYAYHPIIDFFSQS